MRKLANSAIKRFIETSTLLGKETGIPGWYEFEKLY